MTDTERRILQAVQDLGDDAYTLAVWKRLGGGLARLFAISLGGLYVRLGEMEERGWMASAEGAATPERGMRPKRLWWVTGEGKRAMEDQS